MTRAGSAFVAGLVLAAVACSKSEGGDVTPDNRQVTVEVINRHALPMEVHVSGSGINHRLGTVLPGMRGTFRMPQNLIGGGSVIVEARPSGGGQPFRSGDLLIAPGSVLDLVIAPQLFSSTAILRP